MGFSILIFSYMSINAHQILFVVIGCLASFAFIFICFGSKLFRRNQFVQKPVLTAFEQKMFLRLHEAYPHYYILAQVAFSALLNAEQYKLRAQFNRKVTDFVILNKQMQVMSIIELDDPSHIGKEQEDTERDAMLHQAGYKVLRFTEIPTVKILRSHLH